MKLLRLLHCVHPDRGGCAPTPWCPLSLLRMLASVFTVDILCYAKYLRMLLAHRFMVLLPTSTSFLFHSVIPATTPKTKKS